jgi:transcriptional regulator with XRE-family HTH domain
MSIGNQINKLLSDRKITRLKLSEDTKIPYTTLTQIINGRTKDPQVRALQVIADYFDVPTDYLLGASINAVIENRLSEINMTIEDLSELTSLPASLIRGIDTLPPAEWDYEKGEMIDRLAKGLGMDFDTLAAAYARQEPPTYDGPVISPEEAFLQVELESKIYGDKHEKELLRKYRKLDDIGKYTVDTTLDAQYKRCTTSTKNHELRAAHIDDNSDEQMELLKQDLDEL